MSQKYRQHGYQDDSGEQREKRRSQPRSPREGPRSPRMPGFHQVRRCAMCGVQLPPSLSEIEVSTKCPKCDAALHSCKNCVFLDPASRFECSQPVTKRISPKDAQNNCPVFEARTTVEKMTTSGSRKPQNARDAFDDLFKWMKIVTCLKEVPARDARYELSTEGTGIKESDLTFEINECDEYSLEESLKLSEAHGGEVTILTAGRQRAEKSIRKGLAMGADRGILIRDEEGQLNSPQAVALALAEVLKGEEYDLILAGTQSDDWSYAQTGVVLAQLLGLPHATIVMEIQADPAQKKVKALREMESGWFQWVELPMPSVLTIQAGISQVRYASLKGIMQAKKKEIRTIELSDLGVDLSSAPQVEVLRVYFPEAEKKAEILEGSTETVVALLVEKLKKEAKVL